jgi:hypothetical protein
MARRATRSGSVAARPAHAPDSEHRGLQVMADSGSAAAAACICRDASVAAGPHHHFHRPGRCGRGGVHAVCCLSAARLALARRGAGGAGGRSAEWPRHAAQSRAGSLLSVTSLLSTAGRAHRAAATSAMHRTWVQSQTHGLLEVQHGAAPLQPLGSLEFTSKLPRAPTPAAKLIVQPCSVSAGAEPPIEGCLAHNATIVRSLSSVTRTWQPSEAARDVPGELSGADGRQAVPHRDNLPHQGLPDTLCWVNRPNIQADASASLHVATCTPRRQACCAPTDVGAPLIEAQPSSSQPVAFRMISTASAGGGGEGGVGGDSSSCNNAYTPTAKAAATISACAAANAMARPVQGQSPQGHRRCAGLSTRPRCCCRAVAGKGGSTLATPGAHWNSPPPGRVSPSLPAGLSTTVGASPTVGDQASQPAAPLLFWKRRPVCLLDASCAARRERSIVDINTSLAWSVEAQDITAKAGRRTVAIQLQSLLRSRLLPRRAPPQIESSATRRR